MPKKIIKTASGRMVEIKSIRLNNGNLLIPARSQEDRNIAVWVEVPPGHPDFKRWWLVSEEEPDPREHTDRAES